MNSDDKNLKIFTLNCWGLRYVSEHRQQRIKLIAQHLAEHDYNIVFLQEIWCQSDYDYIITTTQSKYKFAHMFKNASILGTSGLVVLTTWTPKVFHFHPFSVNGSPFRPFHGDWFTSKGIGYVRIDLDALKLHLFCTHVSHQVLNN
jgi:sphingomyelin phosphodiesterase 2